MYGIRDEIDILRVKLWYEEVRYRLSANSSYQIEKIIEPDAFGKNQHGDAYHKNKWSSYQSGKHTPSKGLIELVELQLHGSSNILNNIFWEVLRGKKDLDWLMKSGVKSLSWEIQKVLHKYNNSGFSSELMFMLNQKELKRLDKLAGLDALAGLIIFLKYANNGNGVTITIGNSIYRVLLIICNFYPFKNFQKELVHLMNLYVLPLACMEQVTIKIDEECFLLEVSYLEQLFLKFNNENIQINHKEKVRVMLEIMEGNYDLRHKIIFHAPLELADEWSGVKPTYLEAIQLSKQWVKYSLKNGVEPLLEFPTEINTISNLTTEDYTSNRSDNLFR